ncbi:MAG: EamA family transporter [Acidocella sp. 20-61-6]|nr:MAG: EamA family transporter [Acidocella sp. 20-61-6]
MFFLPRPAVSWRNLAAYGILIGSGQFGLLFLAMDGHISPGLASLVIQVQVFFTIFLSMARNGERLQAFQIVSCLLAISGIVVIAAHVNGHTTPLGLALVLLAAACWASGNIVAREGGPKNFLAYVVWGSLFSAPPLLAMSLIVDGPTTIVHALSHATPAAWVAVVWQSLGNSWFGYASWAFLLARYPSAIISPMALLVPVFGMAASVVWLGEPMPGWKLSAAALVIIGLAVSVFYPRLRLLRIA